ncbi:hypothetical protein BDBG_08966 [Blastomyces gilchristii SLH14081]|uniref:Uncharacterized protein n=1 Tax=Blastomyces gilchristii (strain SLH14081) TaxID=559298 RepID=A0A179V0I7_BLAGS|nr:uncharacterized protein BDBG_08966 [Blastomyces gilchristii SLH14081]OAT13846.1 hypothetical protein BDBG_08966 [Blastomyces gilchristii SLH14081]
MSGCGWTSGRRKRSEEAVEQATKEALVVREWSLDTKDDPIIDPRPRVRVSQVPRWGRGPQACMRLERLESREEAGARSLWRVGSFDSLEQKNSSRSVPELPRRGEEAGVSAALRTGDETKKRDDFWTQKHYAGRGLARFRPGRGRAWPSLARLGSQVNQGLANHSSESAIHTPGKLMREMRD